MLCLEWAAAYCRRAVSTIRTWIRRYHLAVTRVGRRAMLRLADVIEAEAKANANRERYGGRKPATCA